MEVRIGVIYSTKELTVEVTDNAGEVAAAVEQALASGGGMLWLTDTKGRRVGVPVDKVAYVEVEEEDSTKRVGFGIG